MEPVVKPHNSIKVAFETLGCKLNQAETESFSRQLAEAGCKIVSPEEKPDIYILNTCTVTHIADRKSRHLLRMAHRRNPDTRIVVLGCYVDSAEKEISKIEGVDLVIGNTSKINLKKHLENAGYLKPYNTSSQTIYERRTRAFIKAQDGCNNFCTYCIVPLVRGREKSLPPENIITEIQNRAAEGFREVVLTGTEVGRYSYEGINLQRLLEEILARTSIPRLRLSSVQPQEINPALIQMWSNPRLCRHFHLSLQSGSDAVLKRMNRRYTCSEYANALEFMRHEIPDVAITTDIIVGFPGETETEFEDSYAFCLKSDFMRIHVFPYSKRTGTQAARMLDQCEPAIKKLRSAKMLSLADTCQRSYQQRFLGQTRIVLFEQIAGGFWNGYTDNYIRVYAKCNRDLTNHLLEVKLVDIMDDGVVGEVLN